MVLAALALSLLCATEDPAATDLFSGFSVAANATDIYAPETGFRVGGWSSCCSPAKLLELTPDGQQVKAGQMVARFEFPGRDAQRWINERVAKVEADAAASHISTDQSVEALVIEKRRKELEARLAGINVEKERALSRRQADVYRIARKVADFEVEAVDQRLVATRRARNAENAFQDESVKKAQANQARYRFYERRYTVYAPHDGIVRHSFNPGEHRKTQKGDAMQAGQKVLAVAKDATLSARFFVPEHRIGEVSVGDEVIVTTPASAEEHKAVVKRIDFFPQELGFLMENSTLPNGREKAFSVLAEFVGTPAGLSAGAELRVKGRPR